MKLPKVFLFEGVDGTGKTTIAKRTAELLRTRGIPSFYFHCEGRKGLMGAPMRDYQDSVLTSIEWSVRQLGVSVVLDRHWPSEVSYGKEYKRAPMRVDDFIERLSNIRCEYIWCATEIAWSIVQERGDEVSFSKEAHDNIAYNYGDVFHSLGETVYRYDLDKNGHEMDRWIIDNLL